MPRVEELAVPRGDHEIFETDVDALLIKPYMTGDIFLGIADGDDTIDIAIAGHPCVIRGAGGQLMTRVPCCVLKPTEANVPYEKWPDGHFDKLPVPDSVNLGSKQAVRLTEWRSIHRKRLTRESRRLAMTERGVYVFQQRFVHAITRVAIPLGDYEKSSRHVLREAALEEEWVDGLVNNRRDQKEIDGLVKDFHAFLDGDEDGVPRRGLLRVEGGEQRLTRLLRSEMKRVQAG